MSSNYRLSLLNNILKLVDFMFLSFYFSLIFFKAKFDELLGSRTKTPEVIS